MKQILKTALILGAALCLCVSLLSCAKRDESVPEGYLDAGTEGVEYRFFYPEDWILDRHDPGMTSVYVSDGDFSNVSVTAFTASAEYPSLESYAESYYFQQFSDNFNNLDVAKNQDGSMKHTALEVDGCSALRVDYGAVFAGENYQFRTWFISYNGSIYTVTYTAASEVFASHADAVDAMVNVMRFQ